MGRGAVRERKWPRLHPKVHLGLHVFKPGLYGVSLKTCQDIISCLFLLLYDSPKAISSAEL